MYLLCACSTKKDNFFYRAYHGTTARFNIIFNGSESYKEGMDAIENSNTDNYTDILPVYPLVNKTEALKQAPQWDRTIEKCSKAIKKHSMLIKGVERCKPIDDAYLLLGKAYYQRQDYADAMGVFNYIINTHHNGNVWPDAHTWKAETELRMDRIKEAEETLETIRQDIANQKKDSYKQHWEGTYSQMLISQKEYEQATIYLSELLKHKHMKKDFKTRILFILAQIQQQLEQKDDATKNYLAVLKRNPIYEMEFNATINLALCNNDIAESRQKLNKLFKDGRNESLKDQIFYTLALLDLAENDTNSAINNLEASVFWSFSNPHQKALSSLTLADLYYTKNNYVNALTYYDTLLVNMPANFQNYSGIKKRSETLKDLVSNLMIINHNDSMLYLASLSESERDDYIGKLIADYQKKEEERLADENEKAQLMENASKRRSSAANAARNSGGKSWIFADPAQNKTSIQNFRKQWGSRVLEDYWFVNDISVMSFDANDLANNSMDSNNDGDGNTDTQASSKSASGARTSNPMDKSYYLQDMPATEEQKARLNNDIATAMYNAGFIYYDHLNDKPMSNYEFESLLQRYPDNKLAAPSCFQLYISYLSTGDIEKSNYYKNYCLSHYPNTDYTRIINDPNYYQTIQHQKQEAENYYTLLYDTFAKGYYPTAYAMSNEGLQKYANSELNAKMEYIRAICVDKMYGHDSLKIHLKNIITRYPTTAIDTAAEALLEALKRLENTPEPVAATPTNNAAGNTVQKISYTYDASAFHFIIIIVDIRDLKINDLKNALVDFNKSYFRRDKFDISNFYIDNTLQMISISKFDNKEKAMDYYRLMITDTKYLSALNNSATAKIYTISDANYTTFFKNKNLRADYESFFKENYLK
ncbi:MAG: tetratricopeptide repeat protein [Bacteroidales bacterium]|nr:tetratricopeptide repeat protein [Bacteroidales bacterium]